MLKLKLNKHIYEQFCFVIKNTPVVQLEVFVLHKLNLQVLPIFSHNFLYIKALVMSVNKFFNILIMELCCSFSDKPLSFNLLSFSNHCNPSNFFFLQKGDDH